MTELWRLATGATIEKESDDASRMLMAERTALEAQATALQTLNRELQRHRATAEKSLTEARGLLARREATLEQERARGASVDQALAQARIELEVALERLRLAPERAPPRQRKLAARKPKPRKASTSATKTTALTKARPRRKLAGSKRVRASSRIRKKSRNPKRK